jgi:hypothetical protein
MVVENRVILLVNVQKAIAEVPEDLMLINVMTHKKNDHLIKQKIGFLDVSIFI